MLRKKYFLFLSLLFLTGAAFFYSCRKEINPSWDVDVLAPLIKSNLTIDNILPDSLIKTNTDNSLDLVYKTSLYSFTMVSVPDTTIDTVYVSFFKLPVDTCTQIIAPQPDESNFNASSVQLTEILIRSGELKISLENHTRKALDVTYQIPSATDPSHQQFNKTVTVPKKSGTNPGLATATFDLSNYKFDLTGSSHQKVNTIITETGIKVNCNDIGEDTIYPGDKIKVSNSFIGIVPEYAKGYFGSTVTNITDTTALSLFRHVIDGTLNLQDINIGLSIENSVGVDARVTIENLSSINSRNGNSTVALTHPIINSPININRAVDNNGNVTSSTYSSSITPSNSNILNFIDNLPDKMSYKLKYEINPLGNVSGGNDFIYYGKTIKTDFNMTIPLSLIATNLTLADTLNFQMNAGTNNVNSGTLYLYADNGFPFTAQAQLYLMNSNFAIMDSLIIAPNVILAPPLDGSFICMGQKETKLTIPVSESKMSELRATKKIYVKIKFNTANQPNYVKIYSYYQMNVRLIGDFNYTVGKK